MKGRISHFFENFLDFLKRQTLPKREAKPCSEATDIGWLLSLGADFGNKNKKVNIGKGRDWGWILGEGTEEAYFRLPNRREPKDLFPLNVTLKPVKMRL